MKQKLSVYLPKAWHCKIFVVPNLITLLLADDVNLGACNEFSGTRKNLLIVDLSTCLNWLAIDEKRCNNIHALEKLLSL